jgi:hypothetical protein
MQESRVSPGRAHFRYIQAVAHPLVLKCRVGHTSWLKCDHLLMEIKLQVCTVNKPVGVIAGLDYANRYSALEMQATRERFTREKITQTQET